jgi:mannose-1-phosphate guanylyltransferase
LNYTIILAGGIGSRFWPLSTDAKPKQFLSLCSNQPLLVQSIKRVSSLTDKTNTYIATNKIYKTLALNCLKKLHIPKSNFLFEQDRKNTLAPIGVLANIIFTKDKKAVIAVFPSDHFIKNEREFLRVLKKAIESAKRGNIVTLGIIPPRPETGFGYIKIRSQRHNVTTSQAKTQKTKIYKVERFIEKPDLKTAEKLVRNKKYYCNAGIFVFKAQTLLEEIKRIQPGVSKILSNIKDRKDLDRLWKKFPAVSIDYAIMEKSNKLKLIPLNCGWSDLGSWQAIEEIRGKDKNGNIFICKNVDLGSKDTLVWSDYRLVATLGLKGLIIVDTKDALLVCSKDKAQEVKKIVEILKSKKMESTRAISLRGS